MRRIRQALNKGQCEQILKANTHGVLGVNGEDGYPYTVPLSYAFEDGKIWFHCVLSGYKMDAIQNSPKCSFCVVHQDDVHKKTYTTRYQSAICSGKIHSLEGEQKKPAIEPLALKYYPEESREHREQTIENAWNRMTVLQMDIEQISGKQGKELLES